ncbi:MAG: glycoside hydrolase family 2 TIM barrel-domain containing protein, partial [Bacteroidota bacterium]
SIGGSQPEQFVVAIEIFDPKGQSVFRKSENISKSIQSINYSIPNPNLWHVDEPNLYTTNVRILKGTELVDEQNETYGYRWFEFKEHGAFYLNGEKLKLRGTHRHEEHAGYGAAVPNEIHRRDIEQIKEMGANMIRLAHYPQDPEVYKACDELGLVVWDELPWCRGGIGNQVWKENTKRLLEEMIEQNYNHPSVVFWSLGNEIYWLPDFEDGDNREKINAFLVELNDIAHKRDPHRLTAIRKYYEGSDIPDVFSPSIWSGWYSGKYTDYQASIEAAQQKYERFIHAEYGGSSHVGRHNEEIKSLDNQIASTLGNEAIIQVNQINYAQDGDWSENYMVDLMDWHLMVSETAEDFAGNLQWAFKDFGTPLRPENDIPYINQKGLVDREGNPKDVYYVYKSYWSEDPFAYIESATWTERYGEKGEKKGISVYSNCSDVELFKDGSSLGRKSKNLKVFPAGGLTWNVAFAEGENELVAIGYVDEMKVYDTLQINYHTSPPKPPAQLALSYERRPTGDILIIAKALDKEGRLSTTYQEKVYFQSLSGGELAQYYGTPTGSSVIAMANGKASVLFRPKPNMEKAMVTVLNQDFKGTYLEIPLSDQVVYH